MSAVPISQNEVSFGDRVGEAFDLLTQTYMATWVQKENRKYLEAQSQVENANAAVERVVPNQGIGNATLIIGGVAAIALVVVLLR